MFMPIRLLTVNVRNSVDLRKNADCGTIGPLLPLRAGREVRWKDVPWRQSKRLPRFLESL